MSATGQAKSSTVQSNAKMLQREGRKILDKHQDRLGSEATQEIRASLAAIDHLKGALDWENLAKETERLDELLQTHASFARKSAIREIAESVGFAVGVALLLRCCTYEPFNIPSISMMPTLRIGDYIFVNKFVHGIQIPFTQKVFAEDLISPVKRGEVIVFKFPADPDVDYIKRVIGLPGDVIRVQGQTMWIQKGGEGEFEKIERTRLDRPCTQSEDANQPLADCAIYEETLDGEKYLIRLVGDPHEMMRSQRVRTIHIPPGKYFVRGDNRRQSQDSLMWDQVTDVASVQKLLRKPDLQESIDTKDLELRVEVDPDLALDPHRARMQLHAAKGGPGATQKLQIWRKAPVPAQAVYQGLRHSPSIKWEASRVDKLLEGSKMAQAEKSSVLDQGRKWDALAFAQDADAFHALMRWDSQDLVVQYQCGKQLCPTPAKLALELAQIVDRAQQSPSARAKELLKVVDAPGSKHTVSKSASEPSKVKGRYFQGRYQKGTNPAVVLKTEVFLKDHEGLDQIEAMRFAAHEGSVTQAQLKPLKRGSFRWMKAKSGAFVGMWRSAQDKKNNVGIVIECQASLCKDDAAFLKRVESIEEDLFQVAKQNLRPAALMRSQADIKPVANFDQPERYAWDAQQNVSTMEGVRQTLQLDLEWKGSTPTGQTLTQWRGPNAAGKAIESQLGAGAFIEDTKEAFRVAWAQTKTDSALLMQCGKDLCKDESQAIALANKISERASNEDNFVARQMSIPQPFVPRGNIKGRSDIIWWPLNRLGESMFVSKD